MKIKSIKKIFSRLQSTFSSNVKRPDHLHQTLLSITNPFTLKSFLSLFLPESDQSKALLSLFFFSQQFSHSSLNSQELRLEKNKVND